MSEQWYFAVSGNQQGPVSADHLRQLVASGQVQSQDLAWREGMPQWTAISLLPEILDNAGAAFAPAAAPDSPFAVSEAAPFPQASAPLNYGGYEPYPTDAYGRPQIQYGGFWIRVAAYLLDYIILYIPKLIIQAVMQMMIFNVPVRGSGPGAIISFGVSLSFIPMVIDWLYFALMETSSTQATLGKMACGLIVTDDNGQRLTFGRATGRFFAKILSALILCIGFIMVGIDQRKRGLHDQIASTLVVKKRSVS